MNASRNESSRGGEDNLVFVSTGALVVGRDGRVKVTGGHEVEFSVDFSFRLSRLRILFSL